MSKKGRKGKPKASIPDPITNDRISNESNDEKQQRRQREQEERDEEIAEILAMGGDPSFFLDNSGNRKTTEQEQRQEEINAILEMGGDPSFFMDEPHPAAVIERITTEKADAARGDPFFGPEPEFRKPKLDPQKGDKQDWFDVGRQMARDFKASLEEEDEEEEESDSKKGSSANDLFKLAAMGREPDVLGNGPLPEIEQEPSMAELDAMGGDPFFLEIDNGEETKQPTPSLEEAQFAALDAAKTLVENSQSTVKSKQGQLTALQTDIQRLQQQLKQMQQQEITLQQELQQAKAAAKQSLEKEQAIRDAFAVFTGESTTMTVSKPEPKAPFEESLTNIPKPTEGPYYTAMEGESYDSVEEEIEAMGGDPFFLENGDDATGTVSQDNTMSEPSSSTVPTDPSFLLNLAQQEQPKEKEGEPVLRKGLRKSALTNEPLEEENWTEEEQLLELGGDPDFRGAYEEREDPEADDFEVMRREIEEMGGDSSFL